MSTAREIPIDIGGATLTRYVEHAVDQGGRHLQLCLRLGADAGAAAGAALDLYLIDVHGFGCLHNFLDSYVESTAGAEAGERLCAARMDGLVYNAKRFSRDQDLFLILRLEGAGFKLNCGEFRFVDPATERFTPVGRPEFQNRGACE